MERLSSSASDDVHRTAFRTHHGHFGLTNGSATFQALMNDILKSFLRRFVLVFFMIFTSIALLGRNTCSRYSSSSSCSAPTNCSSSNPSFFLVRHLWHIWGISSQQTVLLWIPPRFLQFLGLSGYYHKFIAGYGAIDEPLTALLKGAAFTCTPQADAAFLALKEKLKSAPLLQLPDFSKHFYVDCDASGTDFGAVPHQGDGALSDFSHAIAPHHAKLPAYERELTGLVKAVRNWQPYLWGDLSQFALITAV